VVTRQPQAVGSSLEGQRPWGRSVPRVTPEIRERGRGRKGEGTKGEGGGRGGGKGERAGGRCGSRVLCGRGPRGWASGMGLRKRGQPGVHRRQTQTNQGEAGEGPPTSGLSPCEDLESRSSWGGLESRGQGRVEANGEAGEGNRGPGAAEGGVAGAGAEPGPERGAEEPLLASGAGAAPGRPWVHRGAPGVVRHGAWSARLVRHPWPGPTESRLPAHGRGQVRALVHRVQTKKCVAIPIVASIQSCAVVYSTVAYCG